MRVYFEKPRTTIGWKGLINDPHLNNSYDINLGLKTARGLLRALIDLGVATGTEYLDPISPQYFGDLVCWGAIGARTTESQIHRQLASGLSCPVGFKNSTDGSVQAAVDAVKSARHAHIFLSVTKQGHSAIFSTSGNEDCHIILRGGGGRPNFDSASVRRAARLLEDAGLLPKLMVDASHANSNKDFRAQKSVCADICQQLSSGEPRIIGVMIESNLVEGRQDLGAGRDLTYGQSVTDACIGWDDSVRCLEQLADAVARRNGTAADRSGCRDRVSAVGLRCHHEVVAVQSRYHVGPPCHGDATPLREDIRMMIFGVGQRTDTVRECERLGEIGEPELPLEPFDAVARHTLPISDARKQRITLSIGQALSRVRHRNAVLVSQQYRRGRRHRRHPCAIARAIAPGR